MSDLMIRVDAGVDNGTWQMSSPLCFHRTTFTILVTGDFFMAPTSIIFTLRSGLGRKKIVAVCDGRIDSDCLCRRIGSRPFLRLLLADGSSPTLPVRPSITLAPTLCTLLQTCPTSNQILDFGGSRSPIELLGVLDREWT